MTQGNNPQMLEAIKVEVVALKPCLDGILVELQRQARSTHDARDFLIYAFRDLERAIDGLTARLERLS